MEKFNKSMFQQFDAQVGMTDKEYLEAVQPTPSIVPYVRTKLTILTAEYKGEAKSDKSWVMFQFILGFKGWVPKIEQKDGVDKTVWYDEKGKRKFPLYQTVLVPTQTANYQGAKGETPFVFRNTQEFVAGLGYTLLPSTMKDIIPTLFGDFEKLVGLEIEALPGFEVKHIAQEADGTYYVADRNGKKLKLELDGVEIPNSYTEKAHAEAEALACNHDVDSKKTFMKLLKIFPAAEPVRLGGKAKTSFDD